MKYFLWEMEGILNGFVLSDFVKGGGEWGEMSFCSCEEPDQIQNEHTLIWLPILF